MIREYFYIILVCRHFATKSIKNCEIILAVKISKSRFKLFYLAVCDAPDHLQPTLVSCACCSAVLISVSYFTSGS